jgi:hypothetical protein
MFLYFIMDLTKLCAPALLYLILSVISISLALFSGIGFLTILIKLIFVAIWTWFLNYLCKKGFSVVSWILVILPFLVMLGMIAIVFEITATQPSFRQ